MANPFPIAAQQHQSTRRKAVKPKVTVITVRRASFLLTFLVWFLPFVQVDNLNVLPSALLLYSLGVCYLHELLVEMDQDFRQEEQEQLEQMRRKQKQDRDLALFELRVLQGRRNVRLVRRTENGVTSLYAID